MTNNQVYPHKQAQHILAKYRCAECHQILIGEATKHDGKLDFENVKVYCKEHPSAEFISRYELEMRKV